MSVVRISKQENGTLIQTLPALTKNKMVTALIDNTQNTVTTCQALF